MHVDEVTKNCDERFEVVVRGFAVADGEPLRVYQREAGPSLWGMTIITPDTFVYVFHDAESANSWRRELIAKHGVKG